MRKISERKRVVVKVGTSTLTHRTGRLNIRRVENLVKTLADLQNAGHEIVLVSSGAIALGMGKLGMTKRPQDTPGKQACAAVGQCELMYMYDKFFAEYSIVVAQVLLTKYVLLEDRRQHVVNSMERLLSQGVIPIVNENDTVAIDELELEVGENDSLAANVATIANADLLVIMSDIDGLYTDDPNTNPNAKFVETVYEIDEKLMGMGKDSSGSNMGTGGMTTKLIAGKIATLSGADMIITNGNDVDNIIRVMAGENVGTLFLDHRASDFDLMSLID